MAIILVADDHPLNRHFLAILLSYYGHQVNEAADGVEAFESARQQRPDLIIADVVMPRMDGLAFVRSLRSDPELAEVPVIFYTAMVDDAESRAIAQAAGVDHLITKPSDPETILEAVKRALRLTSPPTRSAKPRQSSARVRQHIERLQLASIRMGALIELGAELFAERDPDRLMRTACRAVRTIFGSDYGAIALAGLSGRAQTWVDGAVDQERLCELLRRHSISANPTPRNVSGHSHPLVRRLTEVMPGLGSVLLLPMSSAGDLYGWVLLGKSAESEFSVDDERLATAAAGQIRAAHENLMSYRTQREQAADLSGAHGDLESTIGQRTSELRLASEALRRELERREAELRSSREQLRALSVRVLSIQEEERTRIARELHDDLGQLLTAIKIDASRLVQDVAGGVAPSPRVMDGIIPLIDSTLDTVGRIVTELRPSRIAGMGLAAAIEKKAASFQERTGIECELSIHPEDLRVRDDVATAAFRILEEALTNVARHSDATRVDVRLRLRKNELLLEVRDNGRGIRDAERLAAGAFGLIGMKERADLVGGALTVTAVEGKSTIVAARIPLEGRYDGRPEAADEVPVRRISP